MKKFLMMAMAALVCMVVTSCAKSAEEYANEYDQYSMEMFDAQQKGDMAEMAVAQGKMMKVYQEAQDKLSEEDFKHFCELFQAKTAERVNAVINGEDLSEQIDSAAQANEANKLENKAKAAVEDATNDAKEAAANAASDAANKAKSLVK